MRQREGPELRRGTEDAHEAVGPFAVNFKPPRLANEGIVREEAVLVSQDVVLGDGDGAQRAVRQDYNREITLVDDRVAVVALEKNRHATMEIPASSNRRRDL